LDGRIAEPDEREARQTGRHVDLDADAAAIEAVQGGGWDDGQHGRHPTGGRLPAAYRALTSGALGPCATTRQDP
jgi:hypothetical protein